MRNDARQPATWVSISAYARNWGLCRNTVYRLIERQQLETYRVLKVVRVRNLSPAQQQQRIADVAYEEATAFIPPLKGHEYE